MMLLPLVCYLALTEQVYSVTASDGGKPWKSEKTKTVRPARKVDDRNKFGGLNGNREANDLGFFKLLKKGDKWSFVDPEGSRFISVGMNSVEPERVSSDDVLHWTNETYDLLTKNGFNTLGRWSDPKVFKNHGKNIPWCSTQGFMKEYAKARLKKNGEVGYPNETIPVFDPEWPEFCKKFAEKKMGDTVNDKYLLGHFSDNELPFRPDALMKYIDLPKEDVGHQAAISWLDMKGYSKSKAKQPRVQAAFLEEVSRLYFETVNRAIKEVDPNHLYIGSRLHGKCISEPVLRGASVCDVISINYYHAWTPEKDKTKDWYKWSKRPFLVSEFYAMKVANKQLNADGAGYRVLSHKDAGEFYQHYTQALLKDHPYCVGWHWFKYADTNDEYQKGIVSKMGEPHNELLEMMQVLNSQVYSLRSN